MFDNDSAGFMPSWQSLTASFAWQYYKTILVLFMLDRYIVIPLPDNGTLCPVHDDNDRCLYVIMTTCILCLTIAIHCRIDSDNVFFCKITCKYGPHILYSDTAISLHDNDKDGPQKDYDKASHLYLTKRNGQWQTGLLCLKIESKICLPRTDLILYLTVTEQFLYNHNTCLL